MLRSPYAVSPSLGLGLDHSPRRSPRGGAAGSSQTSGPQGSRAGVRARPAARSVRWRRSAPRSSTRARGGGDRSRLAALEERRERRGVEEPRSGCRVGCRVGRRAARSGGRFADGGEERASRTASGTASRFSEVTSRTTTVGSARIAAAAETLFPTGIVPMTIARGSRMVSRAASRNAALNASILPISSTTTTVASRWRRPRGWSRESRATRTTRRRRRIAPLSARRWTTTGRRGAPEARGGTRGGRGEA